MKENTLSVCEIYPTIQGEGFLIGSPVTLVRFQGCNIYCSWCDTKYAIPFKEELALPIEEFLQKIANIGRKHILLTGGEPFAHPILAKICKVLIENGYFVQIETNGTLWQPEFESLPREQFYISLSPKYSVGYRINPKFSIFADELKMVVDKHLTTDVLLRKEFLPLIENKKLILQPEGNKKENINRSLEIIDFLLRRGLYARLIPQMHKLINLP